MPVHAFVFPGQGSQAVGMGRELAAAFAAAREVFGEVDEVLKQKLSKLMFEGPAEELTLTENTQPALMAMSLAVLRVIEQEGGFRLEDKATLVAGHSLGEYSALAAAGSFTLAETAKLLRLRGAAMQRAVPPGEGAMAALLPAELEAAQSICADAAILVHEDGREERQVVEVANDNGGGQVVISGHSAAVERAVALAKERGVRRAMLLPVSAPFHCALMAPAADAMRDALGNAQLQPPVVPLVANVTAERATEPAEIRDLLVRQVTGMVRWRESVLACIAMGVDSFVELGAGKVLSGLVRRINPDVAAMAASHAGGDRNRAEGALMFRLDGKTALVTGASGGIGAAIARALHAQGAKVALSGTRADALEALATELGEGAAVCPADLRDPAAADSLLAAAEAAIGPLHILVNNAGLTRDGLAMRMKDEDWATVLDIDLSAPFRLARAALRGMLRRRAGRIIAISSIVGATGNPGQANYAAAKAGLGA